MATITTAKARAFKTISGNSPKVAYYLEGISQTFKKGALLYLTASGTCKVMVANGAATGFDTIRKRLLGLALADANNTTSPTAMIPVHVDDGDTLFLSNVVSRTSTATATLARLDVGKAGGCSLNSSRVYFDRTASAAASIARCVDLVDAVGDTNGRVVWQLLPGARIFS